MSLFCKLKNLVHKGILKEKDLERIVIIPKDQQPCDCISREQALKCFTWTNTKEDVYYGIKALLSIQSKTDVLDKIKAEIEDTGAYEQEVNGKTEFLKGISYCLAVIDKYKTDKKPTCGDCKEWGTVNCPETYREPTKNDDICDSFKAEMR